MLKLQLFNVSLALLSIVATAQPGGLPRDAEEMLKTFPDQAITLRLVVTKALLDAESFKQIQANAVLAEVPRLQALAPLDWRLLAKAEWAKIENEQFTPYAPQQSRSMVYTLGVTKGFSSGTSLGLELAHGRSELTFGLPGIPPSYYESRLSLQLAQKLWQDAFGRATRKNLEAGELGSRALGLGVKAKSEEYILQLIQVFYDAWLAKSQVKAAIDNVARRERLAKIMNIKVQRGTAEEPERLQVQSALTAARAQEAEARQGLRDRWYSLVLTLKLPESWLAVDPYLIPIKLDEPVAAAEKLCAARPATRDAAYDATTVRRAESEAAAAELQYAAARDSLRPNLELTVRAISNGINLTERNDTWGEVRSFENSGWTVGLQLTMPWSHYAEEIRLRQTLTEQQRARAAANDSIDQWRRQWLSTCDNLRRLKETAERLDQAFQNQTLRAELEERRYGVGRSSIISVIQAGDDATAAELGLRQVQMGLRRTAWNVNWLSHGLSDNLKTWGIDKP